MKTTIDISDSLLREAHKLADRDGITLRALDERGLRRVVDESKRTRL
jgi:thiamine monophosphate kinase